MPTKKEVEERHDRARQVNELLRFIGDHGRHFFREDSDRPVVKDEYRYDYFCIRSNHRVWFSPRHGKDIWMHHAGSANAIHRAGYGGTLTRLVMELKDYILTGKQLCGSLGPFPDWVNGGDPWGYKEDMKLVREKALELGIYKVQAKATEFGIKEPVNANL